MNPSSHSYAILVIMIGFRGLKIIYIYSMLPLDLWRSYDVEFVLWELLFFIHVRENVVDIYGSGTSNLAIHWHHVTVASCGIDLSSLPLGLVVNKL